MESLPDPTELLQLIVEVSIALAGFAGIVVAISSRGAASLSPIQKLNLTNLLATSFAALFLSLITLTAMSADVPDHYVWAITSGLGFVGMIFFAIRSINTVVKQSSNTAAARRVLLAINLPLSIVCIAQLYNVLVLQAFWPTFVLMSAFFAVGCYSFVRLLFAEKI